MKFRRAKPHVSEADSPFLRARLEWNDRFYGLARGKRNWQIVASALLLVNFTLAVGLTWLSTQSRITRFIVEVDLLGQAVAFGPAEKLRKTDERMLRYELGMYVRDVRTVLFDSEAQKELLTRAYAHTRGSAVAFLNDHFTRSNPFEVAARQRIDVEVRSILQLSDNTWQIQWLEKPRSLDGRNDEPQVWQAVFSVEVDPPETTDAVLINPLGLYITEIHWTPTL
jgi:type IV secretion system protein VirB5